MLRIILAIVLTVLLLGSAVSQQKIGSSGIKEATLRAHIKFLADDMLEGRGTGARGGELAAKYIAAQLEAVGAKGAGENGSFFQPVSLVGVKADPGTVLTIAGASGSENLKFADDFVAFTGAQTEAVNADADLVFVGYGINAPEQKWNDYKGADTDYRGKILVMLVNDPPATSAEPNFFGAKRSRITAAGPTSMKKRRVVAPSEPSCCTRINPLVTRGALCERRTAPGASTSHAPQATPHRFYSFARG